jgi:signal transduction histidine kinase
VTVLLRGTTYRRAVFLLLGAVLVLPYVLLGVIFVQAWRAPGSPRGAVVVLAIACLAIALVPPFLHGTRAIEIAAARWLLAVELPEPVPAVEGVETRLRSALWFAVHLVIGGLVGLAALICLPLTLVALLQPFGDAAGAMQALTLGPLDEHNAWWLTLVGLLVTVALLYAVAGLGTLAATMAPVLLGPSPGARIAALEAESVRLAERNRLARELHDSVGHALTVTTLQAAAARQVLTANDAGSAIAGIGTGTDLAFVGRALAAIEETGRWAMADLDTVLGVLRDDQPRSATASRSLRDLGRLLDETGATVDLRVDGRLDGVPPVVSREGYRIVQESLTNALRHAVQSPVMARLSTMDDALEVTVSNPLTGPTGSPGRGLAGMAERVALLGGRFTAGPANGVWSVTAHLPFGRWP